MVQHHKTLIDGQWMETGQVVEVRNKYTGRVAATVPRSDASLVCTAVEAAARAFQSYRRIPAHARSAILAAVADRLWQQAEAMAEIISLETGKALKFALNEAQRSSETFQFAAEEAKRIHGETIPMDASRFGENRFGYFIREPLGVVGAITPFNFPLNLVAHKVAPALAAGNTVVLKPASTTPLSALKLGALLMEAGLPPGALNIVVGPGPEVGDALVTHPACRKITFTGSAEVGEQIIAKAGIKKVTLELGNNSAVLIEPDADLEKAADRCVASAFANAGQVCISLQRIYVHRDCLEAFTQRLVAPVVSIVAYDDFAGTLARINASDYGLQAGVYTNDIRKMLQAVETLEVGGVMINDTPTFRLDHFPYGGNKRSGLGREGVRFALEEMTTIKMVVINRN